MTHPHSIQKYLLMRPAEHSGKRALSLSLSLSLSCKAFPFQPSVLLFCVTVSTTDPSSEGKYHDNDCPAAHQRQHV